MLLSKKALIVSALFLLAEILIVYMLNGKEFSNILNAINIIPLLYTGVVISFFSESKQNILRCLLFGIVNSVYTIALLFKLLHFPGSIFLIFLSIVICASSYIITFRLFKKNASLIYRNLSSVAAINTVFTLLLLSMHFLKITLF